MSEVRYGAKAGRAREDGDDSVGVDLRWREGTEETGGADDLAIQLG